MQYISNTFLPSVVLAIHKVYFDERIIWELHSGGFK